MLNLIRKEHANGNMASRTEAPACSVNVGHNGKPTPALRRGCAGAGAHLSACAMSTSRTLRRDSTAPGARERTFGSLLKSSSGDAAVALSPVLGAAEQPDDDAFSTRHGSSAAWFDKGKQVERVGRISVNMPGFARIGA